MIDRERRDKLAQILRWLGSGLISNDEFEDRRDSLFDGVHPWQHGDPAIAAISEQAWFLYHDLDEYKLKGAASLSGQDRREVARWIVFLHSDLEYEWPRESFLDSSILLNIITLGFNRLRRLRRLKQLGDWEVWPFIRRADSELARRTPRLLSGQRRARTLSAGEENGTDPF